MLNALRVDIRRYLMTKSLLFSLLFLTVVCPIAGEILLSGISGAMGVALPVTMNDYTVFSNTDPIYLALLVSVFLYAEAGEGIIRNKIISGKRRHEILLSYCIVNAFPAIILRIVTMISTTLAGLFSSAGLQVRTADLIRYAWVSTLAEIAVSVLYTVLFLCFCTSKAAVTLPACTAIAMKLAMTLIADALYPDSGIPKVSGTTLKVYEAFDRYSAFSHLTGGLRWDNLSYLTGNVALIAVSLLAGILVFSRKDLK